MKFTYFNFCMYFTYWYMYGYDLIFFSSVIDFFFYMKMFFPWLTNIYMFVQTLRQLVFGCTFAYMYTDSYDLCMKSAFILEIINIITCIRWNFKWMLILLCFTYHTWRCILIIILPVRHSWRQKGPQYRCWSVDIRLFVFFNRYNKAW